MSILYKNVDFRIKYGKSGAYQDDRFLKKSNFCFRAFSSHEFALSILLRSIFFLIDFRLFPLQFRSRSGMQSQIRYLLKMEPDDSCERVVAVNLETLKCSIDRKRKLCSRKTKRRRQIANIERTFMTDI